jgi:hypothetical protein
MGELHALSAGCTKLLAALELEKELADFRRAFV